MSEVIWVSLHSMLTCTFSTAVLAWSIELANAGGWEGRGVCASLTRAVPLVSCRSERERKTEGE